MPTSISSSEDNPTGHGHAALLLVESLIHALVDRSILTRSEAIELVEIAAETERDGGRSLNGNPGPISLLQPIAQTLRIDLVD